MSSSPKMKCWLDLYIFQELKESIRVTEDHPFNLVYAALKNMVNDSNFSSWEIYYRREIPFHGSKREDRSIRYKWNKMFPRKKNQQLPTRPLSKRMVGLTPGNTRAKKDFDYNKFKL